MKGIINIGNSCYLNSALQMLLQNIELMRIIIKYGDYTHKLKIFKNFIKEYYFENSNNIINPIEIKKLLDERINKFVGVNQHDSTEVLIFILDILESEFKNIFKLDEFKKIFNLTIKQKIKCKTEECFYKSEKSEINYYLLLSIDNESKTLDDLYNITFNKEIMDKENKYFCDKCNKKSIASKKIKLELNSNNMIVCINRYIFDIDSKQIKKNNQDIDIPLEWIFNSYLQNAIIHYGSVSNGHYISVGKFNNKWYLFNDTNVSEITLENLNNLLKKAYFLYYVKNN